MNLRQMAGWGKPTSETAGAAEPESLTTCLAHLIEGAVDAMPRIDAKIYGELHGTATRMALQIPNCMLNADRLQVVGAVLHEFANYRKGVEEELRNREKGWQSLTSTLVRELLVALGVNSATPGVMPLTAEIHTICTAEEIRVYRAVLDGFLELQKANKTAEETSRLHAPDTSTANDNAAGLLGGGAAVEHLRKVMERGATGFVVQFRLSCMEMVNQRFGPEAVEDCLMAVSAYLTASLHGDDAIFHWSDSSLMAILLGRANEQILTAELLRIAAKNSDINVKIGGRSIMLRIPISFDLNAIDRLENADALYKLSLQSAKKR